MPLTLAPPLTGLAPAKLDIEGQGEIPCWFNPKEYSITKQNSWEVKAVTGTNLPVAQFTGGQARKLTLDLLFDSSDSNLKVREVTDKLFKMMEINPSLGSGGQKNSGRPPMVTFKWGSVVSFKAVCDNLSIQYTLFRPDGEPIRAQAKVSLIQVEKAKDKSTNPGSSQGQNPTTRAIAGISSHVVRDGDSLQSIAYSAYGDPTRWRPIAEANGIDDPLRLRRGTTLTIPRIED